jgi:two-component system, cell cycle sensor histidine kinase and response regulator CckA
MKTTDETTQLRAVFDALTDAVLVIDREGRTVMLNSAQARGQTNATVEQLERGLPFLDSHLELIDTNGTVLPLEDWPVSRALRGEVVVDFDVHARRRSGTGAYDFRVNAAPIRNPMGEITMAVVVTRNMTQTRRVERALRESEQRFAAVFSRAPFGIAVTRVPDNTLESVNDAFLDIFECQRENVIGHESIEVGIVDADSRARVASEFARAGVVRDLAVRRRTARGGIRHLTLNVDALTLDDGPKLLTTIQDVTARNQAMAALEKSEARYRALFEQTALGVAHVESATGLVLEVNERMAQMLGYTREELTAIGWQQVSHPDDLPASLEEVANMRVTLKPFTVEKRYLHRGGHVVWARVTVTPVTALPGERQTQIAMVEDITIQRRVTEQFHQAQKLESIGRLAGGVAHDFNNLLTVILSYAEMLRNDVERGQQVSLEDLQEIQLAGQRAQDLTRQLLAFARRQPIMPVALELNSVVLGSHKMLRRLVGEDVLIETSLTPEPWSLWGDRGQLEQVVMRDAMPRGGTLCFETRNVSHGPDHATPGEWAQLTVKDTGEGMSAEVKEHLFEPFFTTKGMGRGTGLGLATVYGIVLGARGHVSVSSEPGRGTTFEFLFPREVRPSEPAAPLQARVRGGNESVLVVEDDAQVREVTVRALEGAGYRVTSCGDPRLALHLPLEGVQLLVTDVVMPDVNGRTLADALLSRSAALKVLFVSGYTHDVISERGVLDAGLHFLPKPFTSASLVARVREVLDAPTQR